MSRQIRDAFEEAITVAEVDSVGGDLNQRIFARLIVHNDPCAEPGINHFRRASEIFVRNNIAEQRQLEAPSLLMLIAWRGFREFVQKMKASAGLIPLQADGHARASRRNRLAARETVGERDPLGRQHLQYLAQGFNSIGMANVHLPSRRRVDSGAGAPPASPSRAIRKE